LTENRANKTFCGPSARRNMPFHFSMKRGIKRLICRGKGGGGQHYEPFLAAIFWLTARFSTPLRPGRLKKTGGFYHLLNNIEVWKRSYGAFSAFFLCPA
jgi:hypothetical protein